MKRTITTIMILSASALLLASCGKEPMPGKGRAQAIKLTVNGVTDTKASVVTTSTLENQGVFNITAFATDKWEKDVVGHSGEIAAGLYKDPVGGELKNIAVNYYSTGSASSYTQWVITGNGDGSGIETDDPAFSWINAVAMNFFAYAPVTINGTRTPEWDNVASPYTALPFEYAASSTSGTVASSDCDDLIFAFASNTVTYESDHTSADFGKKKSGEEYINLKFYHALAQIRFCVSTNDDTYDSSLKLVSVKILGPQSSAAGVDPVTFAGLPSAGNCTFAAPASSAADPSFTWTPYTTATYKAFYSQTFNADFSSSTPTNWELGSYTPSGSSESKNLYTCTGDVLFLIPQTISGCNIEVTFQQGTDPSFSMVGKLPDGEWKAGKYYTYKIKASKGLDITLLTSDWYDASSPVNF